MKLTLEHLAPYLPYGLKIKTNLTGRIFTLEGISYRGSLQDEKGFDMTNIGRAKPILRPLSDLFNGNYEFILDEFSEWDLEIFETTFLSELRPLNAFDKINYTIVLLLLKNHFDIYRLIEQDLAIDINTLAQ